MRKKFSELTDSHRCRQIRVSFPTAESHVFLAFLPAINANQQMLSCGERQVIRLK